MVMFQHVLMDQLEQQRNNAEQRQKDLTTLVTQQSEQVTELLQKQ